MQDKVTGLVLDSSKDNSKIQAKVAKMVESEIGNLGIDREELVGRLREIRHDVHDLKGRLSAVELADTQLVDHSYTDEERSDMLKLKFDLYDPIGAFPRIVSKLATISNKLESGGVSMYKNTPSLVIWMRRSGSRITRGLLLSVLMV
jgi:hypothetical protein